MNALNGRMHLTEGSLPNGPAALLFIYFIIVMRKHFSENWKWPDSQPFPALLREQLPFLSSHFAHHHVQRGECLWHSLPLLSQRISRELQQSELPASWSRVPVSITLPKQQRLLFPLRNFLCTTASITAMGTSLSLGLILSISAQCSGLYDATSSKTAPTDRLFLAPSMDDSCRFTALLARRNFLEYCQIQTELERWQFPKK